MSLAKVSGCLNAGVNIGSLKMLPRAPTACLQAVFWLRNITARLFRLPYAANKMLQTKAA